MHLPFAAGGEALPRVVFGRQRYDRGQVAAPGDRHEHLVGSGSGAGEPVRARLESRQPGRIATLDVVDHLYEAVSENPVQGDLDAIDRLSSDDGRDGQASLREGRDLAPVARFRRAAPIDEATVDPNFIGWEGLVARGRRDHPSVDRADD